MLYHQITRLGGGFEVFVVVGVPPATILHALLVVEVVAHFVEQSSNNILNRARQRSSADVDFPHPCFAVHAPRIVKGVMAVSLGRALNGDMRSSSIIFFSTPLLFF